MVTMDIFDASLRSFVEGLCRDSAAANAAEEGIHGILMYDPFAIFCVDHPECFSFKNIWM
jgi:hypothetical protein